VIAREPREYQDAGLIRREGARKNEKLIVNLQFSNKIQTIRKKTRWGDVIREKVILPNINHGHNY
jgi:hypothetical protein